MNFFTSKKCYIFFLLLLLIGFLSFMYKNNTKDIAVFNPLKNNTSIDINADGINDIIELNNTNITVKINNNKYLLNNYLKDNTLTSSPSYFPYKAYVLNLSRSLKPEIVIQSNNNNNRTISILSYNSKDFTNVYTNNKNIFGILDYKSSKTPLCFSLNSNEGSSSIESFMIIQGKAVKFNKFNYEIPGLFNTLKFIDLIETDYELEEIPDIFTTNINSDELGILWNLDKEHYNYSFQDGFFIDNYTDNSGVTTSLLWRLTFEGYKKNHNDNYKKQIIIHISCELTEDGSYKINSIYK